VSITAAAASIITRVNRAVVGADAYLRMCKYQQRIPKFQSEAPDEQPLVTAALCTAITNTFIA
jgi:hypothetical protein